MPDLPSADPVRSCWVLQWPIDDEWTAVGFYWLIDGRPRLGELRVVPRSAGEVDTVRFEGSSLARWFAEGLYEGEPGVYGQVLRRAETLLRPMQKHMDEAVPYLSGWANRQIERDPTRAESVVVAQAASLPSEVEVLTPAQISYLQVAFYYVEFSATHAHPNPKVAALLGLDVAQVRDKLRFARDLGFLESGGVARRAGGRLTPKGQALATKYSADIQRTARPRRGKNR